MTNNNPKKPQFRVTPLERRVLLSATNLVPELGEINNPGFDAKSFLDAPTDLNESACELSNATPLPLYTNYCFELIKTWRFDTSEVSNSDQEVENAVYDQSEPGHRLPNQSLPLPTNCNVGEPQTIGDRELDTASQDNAPFVFSTRQQIELDDTDHRPFERWNPGPEENIELLLPTSPPYLNPEGFSTLESNSQSLVEHTATSLACDGLSTSGDNTLLDSDKDVGETEFVVCPSFQADWEATLSKYAVAYMDNARADSDRPDFLEASALAVHENNSFGSPTMELLMIDDLPSMMEFHENTDGIFSNTSLITTLEYYPTTAARTIAQSLARDVILVDRQLNDSQTLIASAQAGSIVFSYDGTSESAASILGKFQAGRAKMRPASAPCLSCRMEQQVHLNWEISGSHSIRLIPLPKNGVTLRITLLKIPTSIFLDATLALLAKSSWIVLLR